MLKVEQDSDFSVGYKYLYILTRKNPVFFHLFMVILDLLIKYEIT